MTISSQANPPKVLNDLIRLFDKMPGIGPKTAARLAFFWLKVPSEELTKFADVLNRLQVEVKSCDLCNNLCTEDLCSVCKDKSRDASLICVVEDALDLMAIERSGRYSGVYHVLGGVVSPVNRVEPEDLEFTGLKKRVREAMKTLGRIEVLVATNPTLEGEATALYVKELIGDIDGVVITRLAQGLPNGADIEFADQLTISRALEQRSDFS